MIGKLKGIIESVSEDALLLDVNGVCYLVYLSARSLQQLPEAGHPATIFIETHVREDHIRPAMQGRQAVHRSEIHANFPLFFANLTFKAGDLHSVCHGLSSGVSVDAIVPTSFRLGN